MTDGKDEKLTLPALVFGGAALLTVILANIGVLARYVFQYSMPAAEEQLRFIFVWLIFICSALSYSEGGLICITMVADALRDRPVLRKALPLFQHVAVLIFSVAMACDCWRMMAMQFEFEELSVVMEINMGWMTLGAFIGFVLMALFALGHCLRFLREQQGRTLT